MDLDGAQFMALLGAKHVGGVQLPVLGLTRRGDLKTKLAAFEAGVDDILTVPFAPEEANTSSGLCSTSRQGALARGAA